MMKWLISIVFVLGCESTQAKNRYDASFWKTWGDGQAQIASYKMTTPRYGEARHGTMVLVTVTETMSESARVKADPGRHPQSDEFLALKQNVVEDFQTGIYDYNVMTSVFLDLSGTHGRLPGEVAKVSFSSQEWCGQVYHQLLFDSASARSTQHSYFDGEGDGKETFKIPDDALSADALWLWGQGLSGPFLEVGENMQRPMVRSLRALRLKHQALKVSDATLSRLADDGALQVREVEFEKQKITFWTSAEGVLQKWISSDGSQGQLVESKRLKYWEMSSRASEKRLSDLGLGVGGRLKAAQSSSKSSAPSP